MKSKLSFVYLVIASLGFVGCAGNPPLPRHPEIASATTPTRLDELEEIVARADIFYLPVDRVRANAVTGPGRRLLTALRGSGTPVTLGWGLITTDEQSLLDQLNQATSDEIIERLSFTTTEHRASCNVLLRESSELGVRSVALACASSPNTDECIASNIARQFRNQGSGKLFVVLERRAIEEGPGVPYLVGQKLAVRQLVLDSKAPPAEHSQILTSRGRWSLRRSFQVVNRAPWPAGNRL